MNRSRGWACVAALGILLSACGGGGSAPAEGPSPPSAADTAAPSVPGALTTRPVSVSQIDLAWAASTDNLAVTGYEVLRCPGVCSPSIVVARPTGTSHNDTGLAAGTLYTYRVRATDAAGNVSGGAAATGTTLAVAPPPVPSVDTAAPSVPGNLGATATSSTQVQLAWTASTDNVAVTAYRVERCAGAGCSNFGVLASPATPAHADTTALAATDYSYRVSALDAAGNVSAASLPASVRTPAASGGPNATVAGAVTVPHPTLSNLSLEWAVVGDANLNGVVSAQFRRVGDTDWSQGMPLRRVPAGSNAGFSWANRHSGSVFDLQPATRYEVALSLVDPDGGSATQTVFATTRAVPAPMAGAPVKAVTPATFASVAATAQPGDILQLAAGSYPGFSWGVSGTAARPIVIRSSAGAVINGEITLIDRPHIHLDGLTIHGRVRFNRSNGIVVTRCTLQATSATGGDGIVSYLRSEDSYIADNVLTGLTPWAEASLGVNGSNQGEGILVTGPGHVIMNNRVRGFRDNISFLEASEAQDQFSIDVLNNDLGVAGDDGVEADYCFHNCRILRNRVTNAFIGMSSQPSLGGPTYFVRNAMYNVVHTAFKLNNTSNGDVLLHNTVVKNGDALGVYSGVPVLRLHARNNLFIGGPGGSFNGYSSGSGRVISLETLDLASSSLDHNGYGATSGSFTGRVGSTAFNGLAQLRSATTEKNAVEVDLTVFSAAVAYPASPMTLYPTPDLRLRAGSAAQNAGEPIPNVNTGYAGSAPDLGAYEAGTALPVYGPR